MLLKYLNAHHLPTAALVSLALGLLPGSFSSAQAQSADIAGVRYPSTLNVEGTPLVLNGSGISYNAVAKVYTVALYLPRKSDNTETVLSQEGPKQLRFVMLKSTRVDELGRIITSGIESNNPREDFFRLIPAIQRMGEQFSHIQRLSAGDSFVIEWVPKRGTVFTVNEQPVGLPIADPGFFTSVLRVWLGKAPRSPDLKTALLDYHAPVLNVLD
ncbi:MAG: chalcone isomerase family protein [Burkholderiales bacterium]|nr:chalcone isomerase family protein [Burkholderiales bacterium]